MKVTEKCNTRPEYLPTDEQVQAREEHYFVLGGYDRDNPNPLNDVFLQRLRLPMVVDSQRAGRKISLPDMASVHRWAATEFVAYEIDSL